MSPSVLQLPRTVRACLFDLDGVLTDTATVHAEAWKEVFDAFLRNRARREGSRVAPFDPVRDYVEFIDGKQRFDGVRSFLASRGIELPEGSHDDPHDAESIGGMANRKNELALTMIHRRGVRAYEGSIRFVCAAREAGLRRAVVSASANCREVRVGQADALREHGADVVVTDLAELLEPT